MQLETRGRLIKLGLPNYRLTDFERELACIQLEAAGAEICQTLESEFIVKGNVPLDELRRLAFFQNIKSDNALGSATPTDLALYEKTAMAWKKTENRLEAKDVVNRLESFKLHRKEPQSLTHMIHAYKGRFYPQMVRALINVSGVPRHGVLLDPFCGSGTTLLESFLLQREAIGVDMHPLACMISRAKINVLNIPPETLERYVLQISDLAENTGAGSTEMIIPDIPNVELWFNPEILKQILKIRNIIMQGSEPVLSEIGLVVLSSIIRPVSNWDPRQLRVRLLKEPRPSLNVLELFKRKFWKVYASALAFEKTVRNDFERIRISVMKADSRDLSFLEDDFVDAIVTSPPYAMALPYVDTDRLSLFVLGLEDRKSIRDLTQRMIGNREISESRRKELEAEILQSESSGALPLELVNMIKLALVDTASLPRSAFRRKNMPGLLHKYFVDMASSIKEMSRILRKNGRCSIVIGNNYTDTGKRILQIPTDRFLAQIAANEGFKLLHGLDKALTRTGPTPLSKIENETVLVMRKQ